MNSVVAETNNPYAALYNPALISAQTTALFAFSTAQAQTNYSPLRNVLINPSGTKSDFQVPNSNMTLWSVGLSYPFFLPENWHRRGGLGLVLSGPYNKLRTFNSYSPDQFYSLRYGAPDSQFQATLGISGEILPEHLYLGGGVSLYLSGAGAADASFSENNPTGRLSLDVGINTAAVVGILGRWAENNIGFTYHQEMNPQFAQSFDGIAPIGGSNTLHLPGVFHSSLYYEPHDLELEGQHDFEFMKVSLGVSYQLWKGFQPPVVIVQTTDSDGKVHTTQVPSTPLRNTFSPRVSLEVPALEKRLTFSVGYQYRPTPVEDLSGATNVLDSDTHIVGLSIQHQVAANIVLPWAFRWGIFGQYHFINQRRVDKLAPDATGAPNYTFSGNAYTYGVSLQAEL